MAVTAIEAAKGWLETENANDLSPAARLTLVLGCEMVNEKRVQAGKPWDFWAKQETLARLVGVTDRQLRRILRTLEQSGVIADTSERVGKGVIKWEVLGERLWADTDVRPDTDVRSDDDTGHGCPPARTSVTDRPDAGVHPPGHQRPTEPEGNPKELQPEDERGSAPSAADAHALPDDLRSASLTALSEVQLEVNALELREWRAETRRVIEEAHDEALALNALVDTPGRGRLREQSIKALAVVGVTLPEPAVAA
jgi:hypothetical protein